MHYILSIIRISLIVFLLTNKATRGNMNDLFNQFLEYLNEVFKRQVGVLYYHGIEDDDIVEEIVEEVKEEAVKILEEVKEEV